MGKFEVGLNVHCALLWRQQVECGDLNVTGLIGS